MRDAGRRALPLEFVVCGYTEDNERLLAAGARHVARGNQRELQQVEAVLDATPDIATYSTRVGTGLRGGLNEPNTGDFFVLAVVVPSMVLPFWIVTVALAMPVPAWVATDVTLSLLDDPV